jgi:hypothetical protein
MRIILAGLALLFAVASVGVGLVAPHSAADLCRMGVCRSDQIFAAIDAQGITPASLKLLLEADPSNPLVWCTYAEALERQGRTPAASEAFEHAVSLGPKMPPVLMRAANFAFTHGARPRAWNLSRSILEQTDAFDGIVFSYLPATDRFTPEVLGGAIPAKPRAAQAWLIWLRRSGSDHAVIQTWKWMTRNGLCDRKSAVEAAWTLWERHSFQAAQQVWVDWMGTRSGDYKHPEQVANRRFQSEPQGGPFDWSLDVPASVVVSRKDGLTVRFAGVDNVAFNHIRQTAVVKPGKYRFSAEIQGEGLTTDQGPFFHVLDAVQPGRLQTETPPVVGTVGRSWISVDFTVPPSTPALIVQLERRASERLVDRNIGGTLHVYQVSLLPLGAAKSAVLAESKTLLYER